MIDVDPRGALDIYIRKCIDFQNFCMTRNNRNDTDFGIKYKVGCTFSKLEVWCTSSN